jgi:hypothetical protein
MIHFKETKMHLTASEVERFYNIWFPLLHYVNQQRRLVRSFPATWGNTSVDPMLVLPLRDALWEDDALRTAFIKQNPGKLSLEDLEIVESWKYRESGNFFIFRHLAKYTVFLSQGAQVRAYGVLGLMDSLKTMTGDYLPIYVEAVLLPFDGRIIYDSLLKPYSILFGGGMRADLDGEYRYVQEREGIITTLVPNIGNTSPESVKKDVRARNKKVLTAFQKGLGYVGLSPKMMEEHTGNIAEFAEKILLAKNPPAGLLLMTAADIQSYLELKPSKPNVVSMKRFLQFLRDTGRMDYEEAERMLKFLKRQQM